MGQRYVQLESTYTGFQNNTGTLHVSQLPPNPAILAPGPALVFVIVKGVPSVGMQVMVGSGKLGDQARLAIGDLPESAIVQDPSAPESSRNAASSWRQSRHWLGVGAGAGAWGVVIVAALLGW